MNFTYVIPDIHGRDDLLDGADSFAETIPVPLRRGADLLRGVSGPEG